MSGQALFAQAAANSVSVPAKQAQQSNEDENVHKAEASSSLAQLLQHEQINWVFSGIVTNENGDNFGYLFRMQRQLQTFTVNVALIDAQNQHILFNYHHQADLTEADHLNWHVGDAFLQYNPINATWIFGLHTPEKTGFNFKVDLLEQTENMLKAKSFRQGVKFFVCQTNHLNGHIQLEHDKPDQFVLAKKAWFRQIWVTEPQQTAQNLQGVLCQFDDGSGFYSLSFAALDAIRGAVVGWFNADGVSKVISQFLTLNRDQEGQWHIRIRSPHLHYQFADHLEFNTLSSGFVQASNQPLGFCVITKDNIT